MEINEVATFLGVTMQTIRNWLNLGSQFFSESATRKRNKYFTNADIKQLQKIRELLSGGLTYIQVTAMLSPAPQVVEVIDTPPEPEHIERQPDQTNALQFFELFDYVENRLEKIKETYFSTINAKDETIQILKDENERLRDENKHLKLPWWKRL